MRGKLSARALSVLAPAVALLGCWLGAPNAAVSQTPQSPTASPQTGAANVTASACPTCGHSYHNCGQAVSLDGLTRMCPEALDQLYAQAPAAPALAGKVNGRAIVWPGSRFAGSASRAARFAWQGKVFDADGAGAVNRFFGIKIIRGNVYYDASWFDGRPALILDYADTSLVYRKYRDEIREVAPGLYLGLMYERTCPQPKFKMYFALEACACQ